MAFSSKPPENSEKKLDIFNPLEVAGYGVKKSVEGLKALLGLKQTRMETVEPFDEKGNEQLAVTKESVDRRKALADGIDLERVEGLRIAA